MLRWLKFELRLRLKSCPIFSCRAFSISCCASSYRRVSKTKPDCCLFCVGVALLQVLRLSCTNWWCMFFRITDLLMKPGCSCMFFGVTDLLRLQMTKNTWLMRFIKRSVDFRRVHQFVATFVDIILDDPFILFESHQSTSQFHIYLW